MTNIAESPPAALELRSVERVYPGNPPVPALAGIDLRVESGEFVAVVGPSGSGKSTLLNVIGTLDRPTAGTMHIAGAEVSALSDRERSGIRAEHLGFVFQQFHLLEGADLVDNVAAGLVYRGCPRRERRRRARLALDRVGLSHRLTHRPPQLSGGERQRVAIARAIVGEPTFVLADEPTGNLDSVNTDVIVELLHELHAQGSTMIVVTHDKDLSATFPRCVQMHDGRIVGDLS